MATSRQTNLTPRRPTTSESQFSSKVKQKIKDTEISNLRVAVRIRPTTATELSTSEMQDIVSVRDNEVIVRGPRSMNHIFQYDQVFWSVDDGHPLYASQESVFISLGIPLLNSAFRGLNACLFAYGQTGSGKTHTMMGKNIKDCNNIDSEDSSGITPRFCRELFKRINEKKDDNIINVEISYFEIYNEKIHDLLAETSQDSVKVPLKVREHPHLGPYIVDLVIQQVRSYEELRSILISGIKNRTVAATFMNGFSSRSHTIFCIEISQSQRHDTLKNKKSKVSLVDLAGSERLSSHKDERTKQGHFINKSLLTLGKCIIALANQKKGLFVPYRESTLTWLLRESLGGNSLTSMVATISPTNIHIEETLSTLRYASQARSIINKAHINENPYVRMITDLKSEVDRLKMLTRNYEETLVISPPFGNIGTSPELEGVQSKLAQTEDKLQHMMKSNIVHMKELMEVEKYKEELESKVRIFSNINPNVSNSPFKTKFLEELSDIVEEQATTDEYNFWATVRTWCTENGFICFFDTCKLTVTDPINKREVELPLASIPSNFQNNENFLTNLEWRNIETLNKKLTKLEVLTSMNEIYRLVEKLQSEENESDINSLFVEVNKSLQSLETALLNIARKTKTVTFQFDQ